MPKFGILLFIAIFIMTSEIVKANPSSRGRCLSSGYCSYNNHPRGNGGVASEVIRSYRTLRAKYERIYGDEAEPEKQLFGSQIPLRFAKFCVDDRILRSYYPTDKRGFEMGKAVRDENLCGNDVMDKGRKDLEELEKTLLPSLIKECDERSEKGLSPTDSCLRLRDLGKWIPQLG